MLIQKQGNYLGYVEKIFLFLFSKCMYRLLITLRYLATGETNRSLSYYFRISPQLISKIIPETVRAIYNVLAKDYLKVRLDKIIIK